MKKLVIVITLVAILGAGTVFASPVHPGGLGLGVLWGSAVGGTGGDFSDNNNVAFSLKLPTVPIFWGIRLGGFADTLWVGIQGDHYFLGGQLVPTLSWYLGVGAYCHFWMGDDFALSFGGRLPIGLTWQPISLLEVFANIVPQIGGFIYTGSDGGFDFPHGGFFGFELGFRVWL